MILKKIEFSLSDFFFKIRSNLFSKLLKKNKGYLSNLSPAIKSLYEKGYYKIDSFYSDDQVNFLNKIFDEVISEHEQKYINKFAIEKVPGEIKIKNIQEEFKVIKSLSCELFFFTLSIIFNFKFKLPSVLFHLVHDGSYQTKNKFNEASKERISGNYHYDSFKPMLKILVLLDNIDENIGAQTSIIPNSARDKRVQKFLFNNTQTIDTDLVKSLISEKGLINCYGKKGDIYLLDTRNIHWGEKLKSGYRRVIWYYF